MAGDVEGIKAIVEAEYRNSAALKQYAADLEAARKATLQLDRAQRRLRGIDKTLKTLNAAMGRVANMEASFKRASSGADDAEDSILGVTKATKDLNRTEREREKRLLKNQSVESQVLRRREQNLKRDEASARLESLRDNEGSELEIRRAELQEERAKLEARRAKTRAGSESADLGVADRRLAAETRIAEQVNRQFENIKKTARLEGTRAQVRRAELDILTRLQRVGRASAREQFDDLSPEQLDASQVARQREMAAIGKVISDNKQAALKTAEKTAIVEERTNKQRAKEALDQKIVRLEGQLSSKRQEYLEGLRQSGKLRGSELRQAQDLLKSANQLAKIDDIEARETRGPRTPFQQDQDVRERVAATQALAKIESKNAEDFERNAAKELKAAKDLREERNKRAADLRTVKAERELSAVSKERLDTIRESGVLQGKEIDRKRAELSIAQELRKQDKIFAGIAGGRTDSQLRDDDLALAKSELAIKKAFNANLKAQAALEREVAASKAQGAATESAKRELSLRSALREQDNNYLQSLERQGQLQGDGLRIAKDTATIRKNLLDIQERQVAQAAGGNNPQEAERLINEIRQRRVAIQQVLNKNEEDARKGREADAASLRAEAAERARLDRESLNARNRAGTNADSQRELETIQKSNRLRGTAVQQQRALEVISRNLNTIEKSRNKLNEGGLTPAKEDAERFRIAQAQARIEDVIAKSRERQLAAARELRKLGSEQRRQAKVLASADEQFNRIVARDPEGAAGLSAGDQIKLKKQLLGLAQAEQELETKKARGDALGVRRAELDVAERTVKVNEELDRSRARFNEGTDRSNKKLSRFLGTLRGTIAGLIAYRGVTRSIQLVVGAINTGITFGTALETTERAIAGLVSSTANLRDSQGRLIEGADAFTQAGGIAVDQLQKLRVQALGTSASFDELRDNFQLNVAQGLNAGLNIDEFRQVALQFSQAATLLGVPQNQLAEEIRSVLQGTIRIRDTRIAVALGITNQEIRQALELDRVAELLEDKFSGVRKAAEALRNTLPVVFSDLKDAFDFAASDSAEGLRKKITEIGVALRDDLVVDKKTGALAPELGQGLDQLFRPLERITSVVGDNLPLISDFAVSLVGAFASLTEGAVSLFEPLAPLFSLISSALKGLSAGMKVFSAVVKSVSLIMESLFESLPEDLREALKSLLDFSGKALGVASAVFLVSLAVKGLNVAFLATSKAVKAARVALVAFRVASIKAIVPVILVVTGLVGLLRVTDELLRKQAKDRIRETEVEIRVLEQKRKGLEEVAKASMEIAKQRREELGDDPDPIAAVLLNQPFVQAREEIRKTEAALESAKGTLEILNKEFKDVGISDDIFGFFVDSAKTAGGVLNEVIDAFGKVGNDLQEGQLDFRLEEQLQSGRLELARVSMAEGTLREILEAQSQIREEQVENQLKLNILLADAKRIAESPTASAAERAEAVETVRVITVELNKRNAEYGRELERQIRLIRERNKLEDQSNRARLAIQRDALVAEARLDPTAAFFDQELAAVQADQTIAGLNLEIERNSQLLAASKKAADLVRLAFTKISEAIPGGFSTTILEEVSRIRAESIEGLESELGILEAQKLIEKQKLKLIEEQNKRRTGIRGAFKQDEESSTGAELFGNATATSLQDLRGGVSQGLALALSGQDVNVAEGAKQLGIKIAGNFADALVQQLIVNPFVKGLEKLFNFGAEVVDPSIVAQQTAATALASSAGGLSGAAGGLSAAAAALTAAAAASGGKDIAESVAGGSRGGLVGFYGGGDVSKVGGTPFKRAPKGLDSRDRIPAMVRRGEFISTPEMNDRVPGLHNWLEQLRRGSFSVPNFASLSQRFTSRPALRGFAAGGAVGASFASRGGAGSGGGITVLPVLVTSEANLRRQNSTPAWSRGLDRRTNGNAIRNARR